MTIHFTDPGYDWTIWIIWGVIVLVPLLVAAFFGILSKNRQGRSSAGEIAGNILFGVVVLAFIGLMSSSIVGFTVYTDRVRMALYDGLEDQGFDGINITWKGKQQSNNTIDAMLNGEPFHGTLEDLGYPKDYAFQITETTSK